jgi:glucose/arabinose dehydrogenase
LAGAAAILPASACKDGKGSTREDGTPRDAGVSEAQTPNADAKDAAARGEALFASRCAVCHRGGGQGPDLGGLLGRPAASSRGFAYSRALRHYGARWDTATLDAFLKAPTLVVPGTTMVIAVPDASERAALVAYVATLAPQPGIRAPRPMATTMPPAAAPTSRAGAAALTDYHDDGPGVRRRIRSTDLPLPYQTPSSRNPPLIVDAPPGAILHVPPGFTVAPFADGLIAPRLLRVAPNGDVFVAESAAGKIAVLRPKADGSAPAERGDFTEGLDQPFGIAFYPPGPSPTWLYVANNSSIVRFAYHAGDLHAGGPPQVIVPKLAGSAGGHWTRDVAFSPDGQSMYVSVGSGSNVAQQIPKWPQAQAAEWQKTHPLGAAWGDEEDRADVLVFDPEGGHRQVFATGIRNCVGLAVSPTKDLWCSTNERDGLGDNLVPDYATRVRRGAFYGWPWFYLGDHEDPRHEGERPDLAGRMTVPDVLFAPHSASLEMTFYEARAFPSAMRGAAFAAMHGSWNHSTRTGYKVVWIPMPGGAPTGEYVDFLTGFVVDDDHVWGRPVGVGVAGDGSLLVTDDASDHVWRVAYEAR